MEDNIHAGHRERMRERFARFGLDSFSDVEALELLLFYALPRRDTNALAHILLSDFGSLRAVMEATVEQLADIPGVGKNAAALIRLTSEMSRRYMLSERPQNAVLKTSAQAGDFLLPLFAFETDEVIQVVLLDNRSAVYFHQEVARGHPDKVFFSVRHVADLALQHDAVRVLIAHNHPRGTAVPSDSDVASTRQLDAALSAIGVELVDHIIVCDDDFVSLRDSGYF